MQYCYFSCYFLYCTNALLLFFMLLSVLIHHIFSISGETERTEPIEENTAVADKVTCEEQAQDTSLWERLGRTTRLDIDSSDFSWDHLQSLHHTEHTSSTDQSEDECNKVLEVCN